MKTRNITVGTLARVEGEGALHVRIRGNGAPDVKLRIYEPPRFFEAFLRGRDYAEAPDITARICGICPIAYQMGAVHAMENAFGITVGGPLRELRRLAYCGEWIESHVLHMALLHAPDFLGYPDALAMARDHPDQVRLALSLKKLGNDIVATLGGREIHPVNARVGGFYRAPERPELEPLRERLLAAREGARSLLQWVATLDYPDFERDYEFVALRHPSEYPLNEGRLVSNRGLDIPISAFETTFAEEHVEHSNALHSVIVGRGEYLVGPLARYNLNFDRLPPPVQKAARAAGLDPECRNPFKSLLVRGVETVFAVDEALRIIDGYERPATPAVEVTPREGTGYGCTEAPRGICYHRYNVDGSGLIAGARIVPPTSQNQKTIESDLRELVPKYLDLDTDGLTLRCEQAVRNYDPCLSCATHHLKLTIERE